MICHEYHQFHQSQDLDESARPLELKRMADITLENIATDATVHRLVTNLEGGNAAAKNAARKLLPQMGKNAVSELIDLMYTTEDKKTFENIIRI